MYFAEAVTMAFRALRTNRLRSALTTLGIVIGVSAVILLVGLGTGMRNGFNEAFGDYARVITLTKVQGSVPGGGQPRDLRDADVTALQDRQEAPDISAVEPQLSGRTIISSGPGSQITAIVQGVGPNFLTVAKRDIVLGRMFTPTEAQDRERVALIGPEVVRDLFGGDNAKALGSVVRIDRGSFEVIGILKSAGEFDNVALMPLSAARSYLLGGADKVTYVMVQAATVPQVPAALEQVERIMDERHNIADPGKRDYETQALQKQLDEINTFMGFLNAFTVAVAAISLLVGAIGVANIMLVSVTERTREIGIRKALGAPRAAIMKQFLIESVVLAGMGGLAGVTVGVSLVLASQEIMRRAAPDFGTPELSWVAVVVAFAVSMVIGLVAGGYPAYRAATLRPVQALRYE